MRFLSISLLIVVLMPFPLQADPPTSPPPCNVLLGPLFCFRTTDISRDIGDSNKFQFEFTVVNWTDTDAAGLVLTLNTGPNPGGGVPAGAPRFSGGSIDAGSPLAESLLEAISGHGMAGPQEDAQAGQRIAGIVGNDGGSEDGAALRRGWMDRGRRVAGQVSETVDQLWDL